MATKYHQDFLASSEDEHKPDDIQHNKTNLWGDYQLKKGPFCI